MIKRVLGLAIALIIACKLLAQPGASQVLQERLLMIHTLQGSFTQTLFNSKGRPIRTLNGKFAIAKPDLLRWEVQEPNQQLLVMDGKTVWIYDVDLKQVKVKPANKDTQANPALLLTRASKNLSQAFSIQQENSDTFTLHPRGRSQFQAIQLRFRGHTLNEIRFWDKLDQESVLAFSNLSLNQSIKQSLFHFTPPLGTDVIDYTKELS